MLSDIEIAESIKKQKITKIAKKLGLKNNNLELYGDYKAKVVNKELDPKGKLILVTAINPTSAGEGKTTMSFCVTSLTHLPLQLTWSFYLRLRYLHPYR